MKTTKNSYQLQISSQGHDSSWLLFTVLICEVFQAWIFICSQAHILTCWMFLCCPVTGTGLIWEVRPVGCLFVWRRKKSRLLKFFFNVDAGQSTKKKKECVSVIDTLSSQARSAELNQMRYLCGILPQNLHTLHTCVISLSSLLPNLKRCTWL